MGFLILKYIDAVSLTRAPLPSQAWWWREPLSITYLLALNRLFFASKWCEDDLPIIDSGVTPPTRFLSRALLCPAERGARREIDEELKVLPQGAYKVVRNQGRFFNSKVYRRGFSTRIIIFSGVS